MFSLIITVAALLLMVGMAVVDRRDKAKVYDSGSSRVAIFLDDAKAAALTAYLGGIGTVTAGWNMISYQLTSQYGPDRDTEQRKDEAGQLMKNRQTRNEFRLITTLLQTDAATLRILEWLEEAQNAVPLRYPLPTNDPAITQWLFMPSATVLPESWRVEAGEGADRTRQVTFVGNADESGVIKQIVELPTDQISVEWDDYADYKDSRVTV